MASASSKGSWRPGQELVEYDHNRKVEDVEDTTKSKGKSSTSGSKSVPIWAAKKGTAKKGGADQGSQQKVTVLTLEEKAAQEKEQKWKEAQAELN